MKNKYFGIPISEGALEKNDGCEDAPSFLFNLFKINGKLFDLTGELEDKHSQIYSSAKQIFCNLDLSEKPVFIGGTHDVTGFIVKAFKEKNKNAKLLIFDAHADCEDALSVTTHEDFVRMLVENKILNGEDIFIFGLRKVSDIEKEFLEENKINYLYFEKIQENFELSKQKVKEFVNTNELYVSFDVDVLDKEIMQATGYFPENGLSKKQTKELLDLVLPKAKAFDLVEFNPNKIKLNEDKLIEELFSSFFD